MHRVPPPIRVLALALAFMLFVIAGGGALAVADDYVSREQLPEGASIAGYDVSAMTREQARDLVERVVVSPLTGTVTVSDDGHTYEIDAEQFVTVDVERMVEDAFSPRADAPLPQRVLARAARVTARTGTGLYMDVDEDAVAEWVSAVASEIDTATIDAGYALTKNTLMVTASRAGASVDTTATTGHVVEALRSGKKQAALVVVRTEPQVTEADLGAAIVIDKSEHRMRFYDEGALVKTYVVTVGRPAYPTPTGEFEITLKRLWPSWGNPGSAWAAGMPAYIPPGYGNPLGTRAINLDIPGIRIHGTWNDPYIGTSTSHGCIRMHRPDIEELFEQVEIGDPVYIVN